MAGLGEDLRDVIKNKQLQLDLEDADEEDGPTIDPNAFNDDYIKVTQRKKETEEQEDDF